MARRPKRLPRWAYDPEAGALVEPASDEQRRGWPRGARPPAQYLNWQMHLYGEWLQFLRSASLANWTVVGLPYNTSAATALFAAVDDATPESGSSTPIRRLVVAATDGGGSCVYISRRGTSWERRTNFPAFTGAFRRIAFLGTRWWICVHDASGGTLLWCSGGSAVLAGTGNWSAATLPGGTTGCQAIAYDPASGSFALATVDKIVASIDGGSTWADATLPAITGSLIRDVVWNGTAFLAVTSDGEILTAAGGSATAGVWTLVASPSNTTALRLSVGPDGQVVAWTVGTGTELDLYATDDGGASWADITPTTPITRIRRLTFADNVWVAATDEASYLWQSNDLEKWTRLPAPYTESVGNAVHDVVYSEGAWVAVRPTTALVSDRAEDLATGAWTPDPMPTALTSAASIQGHPVFDNTVETNDGSTWVTVLTIPCAPSSMTTLDVTLSAILDDGTEGGGWKLAATLRRGASGAPALLGTEAVLLARSVDATWAVRVTNSASAALVQVRGAAGKDVTWRGCAIAVSAEIV